MKRIRMKQSVSTVIHDIFHMLVCHLSKCSCFRTKVVDLSVVLRWLGPWPWSKPWSWSVVGVA